MPVNNINTSGDIGLNYEGYLRAAFLEPVRPNIPHTLFGVQERVPMNAGSKITFNRPRRLALATTELVEAENPVPVAIGSDIITGTLQELGQFFAVSSKVLKHAPWRVTDSHVPQLRDSWAQTLDKIAQATLVGGTNRFYANGVASASLVASKALATDFDRIEASLLTNMAQPITEYIDPNPNVGTVPVDGGFVCIVHPDVKRDIENSFANFIRVRNYPRQDNILPGEFGSYGRIRFIMSQQADAGTVNGITPASLGLKTRNAGANTAGYQAVIISREAYGIVAFTDVETHADLGYAAAGVQTDALKRVATFGWAHDWTALILDNSRMAVYTCGAST